jgi:hypothetical protein
MLVAGGIVPEVRYHGAASGGAIEQRGLSSES